MLMLYVHYGTIWLSVGEGRSSPGCGSSGCEGRSGRARCADRTQTRGLVRAESVPTPGGECAPSHCTVMTRQMCLGEWWRALGMGFGMGVSDIETVVLIFFDFMSRLERILP